MNVNDLYFDVLCEDEDKDIIDKIVLAIKKDGFDISQFSLASVECYTWEFVSHKDTERGFLLFYDPNMVNEPIPQYSLINGFVAHTFNARNITEAYIQHNRRISDEDYDLLSKQYSKAEIEYHKKAQELAKEYGATVICKIYNCTEGWLLKDKASKCDLYQYDQERGIGCCTYDSDMPEYQYADCKYLQDSLKG